MFSILIIEVFKKAKKEIQSDVVTHLSVHITDFLWEKNRFQINERTLRNYYRKAASDKQEDTIKLSPKVALLLCQYLGYDSYYNFILHHKRPNSLIKTILESSERNIILTLISLCLLLIIVNLNLVTFQKKKSEFSFSIPIPPQTDGFKKTSKLQTNIQMHHCNIFNAEHCYLQLYECLKVYHDAYCATCQSLNSKIEIKNTAK